MRTDDLISFARGAGKFNDIPPNLITRDIMNLLATGNLIRAGSVRDDNKGGTLYLPKGYDPVAYTPKGPLTWLEEVIKAFSDLWADRVTSAKVEGRNPRPVSTSDVRKRLAASPSPHPNLADPRLVPNAMLTLAKVEPVVRAVAREGERAVLWVPVDVADSDFDLGPSYINDTKRVGEALRRAVCRLGRPANAEDVAIEVDEDHRLRLTGQSSIASVLREAAKEKIDWKGEGRRARVKRRVFSVGRVGGQTYYHHDSDALNQARAYVRMDQIRHVWESLAVEEQMELLSECLLPTTAVGRVLLLSSQTHEILHQLDTLIEEGAEHFSSHENEELRCEVRSLADQLGGRLSCYSTADLEIPGKVIHEPPLWNARELLEAIKPLYPAARKANSHTQLSRQITGYIRRIPNAEYESRFSDDPSKSYEYFYDRTDALLFMASKWGGQECRLHARLAQGALGPLRDARFVYPTLNSKDLNHRIMAVACLAFLRPDGVSEKLRKLAIGDIDSSVRQSALWAYGFTSGESWGKFTKARAEEDPDARVRAFAGMLDGTSAGELGLWET